DGCPIMPDGLLGLALALQHSTQVAMSFRVVRAALQSFTECSLCFAVSFLAYQKNSKIVVTLWKVRIDLNGGLILVLGLLAQADPGIERNQVRVRLSEPRILLHCLLMLGYGAIDLACVLHLYPPH